MKPSCLKDTKGNENYHPPLNPLPSREGIKGRVRVRGHFRSKKTISSSILIGLLLFTPIEAYAADLFVQSAKAPILTSPSLGSPKAAVAIKGEVLKEMEKKGDWYKVAYKDKTGWVSRLLVGTKPPAARVSIFEETGERLEKGARKRASAFATAAAARGLAEDRARVSAKFNVDYNALEAMERVNISDDEAARFIREGVGK